MVGTLIELVGEGFESRPAIVLGVSPSYPQPLQVIVVLGKYDHLYFRVFPR